MAAVSIVGRSASSFARTILRSSPPSRTSRLSQISFSNNSLPSNVSLRCQTRISPAPSRLVRRELSTLLPVHSAISAACLVSKLPSEASTSMQGRFANYLSPI